jgi:predicted nucleotidyltransferase
VYTLDSYRQGWAQRQAEADEAAAHWRADAWGRAHSVATELASQFGVTRVVVFGSLARGRAGPGSDVDLLVDGLPPDRYWEAAGVADRIMHPIAVDLAAIPAVRPEVLTRALAEGRCILGA